jgi:type IV pilus assembly protein PilV
MHGIVISLEIMFNKPMIPFKKTANLRSKSLQEGVVIIEALIAILIFSMGVLALVGLQAAMIKNTSENKFRSDASFLAQERLGQLWADPENLANNAGVTDVSNILPNGTTTVVVGSRGLVTVTVNWQEPGGDAHRYETSTYIGAVFNE